MGFLELIPKYFELSIEIEPEVRHLSQIMNKLNSFKLE